MASPPSSTTTVRTIVVKALSAASTHGVVIVGGRHLRCALGRGGIKARKREGDGATPRGIWAVRRVFYRPDKGLRPGSRLAMHALRRSHGWCDAPTDRNYNKLIHHPYPASAERMWRDDHLYDTVLVLGHNDRPRLRGRGSAIFVHLARDGYQPTDGCIALTRRDLRQLLAQVGPRTRVVVG